MTPETGTVFGFGPFRLDVAERLLYRDGEAVKLRAKIFDTLCLLVQNHGRLVRREEFIERLWPGSFVEENNLAYNIALLRKALGESQGGAKYIETVPGQGYRFISQVVEYKQSIPAPALTVGNEPQQPVDEFAAASSGRLNQKRPILTHPVALVLAVLLIAAGVSAWRSHSERGTARGEERMDSVAILPIVSLAKDAVTEQFADGLTVDITAGLAKVAWLRVPARTSMLQFKDKAADVRLVGQTVKVKTLLEGSVRRQGERFVVTAKLIDTTDGYHLWAEMYDETSQDSLALQREIAQRISASLKEKLAGKSPWRTAGRLADDGTLERYFQARNILRKWRFGDRTASLGKALQLFDEVISRNSSFSRGRVGRADALVERFRAEGNLNYLLEAKAELLRAVASDDTLPDAHSLLSVIYLHAERNIEAAESEVKRAIDLSPRDVVAVQRYADLMRLRQNFRDAIQRVDWALTLQPDSSRMWAERGLLAYDSGNCDDALRSTERALHIAHAKDPRGEAQAHWVRGLCHTRMNRLDQAENEFRLAAAMLPAEPRFRGSLGHILGRLRKLDDARALLAEAGSNNALDPYSVALIQAALGEREKAIESLLESDRARNEQILFVHLDRRFDLLRDDPRFRDLLQRLSTIFSR